MVASLQRPRDPIDLIAWAQKQAHAPVGTERYSVGDDRPDALQTSLAPQLSDERSACDRHLRSPQPPDDRYEHTVTAQGLDQTASDILRAAPGFQAPNRESVTERQNAGSCSNLGLGEEALVRLEAALRAQREKQPLAPPIRLIAAPEIAPSESDGTPQEPDKIALPPPLARFGFCAQDTTHQLARTIRPQPVPRLSVTDNEGCVQTPDTFNSQPPQRATERLQPSESPPSVENDVEEYLRWLAPSGECEAGPQRLPRAVQLLPVTGLPPVGKARAGEAFINGFRVRPSLVAEHRRASVPMQQRRGYLITPLLMITSAVAILIAYHFSVGNFVSRLESARNWLPARPVSEATSRPPDETGPGRVASLPQAGLLSAEFNGRTNPSTAGDNPQMTMHSDDMPTGSGAKAGLSRTLSSSEFSTATGTTRAITRLDSVHQVSTESSATAVLDLQDTKPDIEAEAQPPAFTCYPSAPAVRQDHPDAWPSWTLRAPGHEGTRCWYATTRPAVHERRTELPPKRLGTLDNLRPPVRQAD
jgi:hypothetical protein